ncbi:hypothetical protein DACRYDRAFT_111714 [Dacryopinax primogenitus]|uniref:SET domain-containing protein n=1 Tax=Dacryopinax primogenitus (strain DJM 731) TaxID=1858805 RepID=M5FNL8_DACPD|nr:uncharacterized protein DACRYDRAFT_111714 [Dacryopinax primogenitus]EJT97670.1 hypothetical protein DACRYDRAFT_111714 [Dacryopinax primogenitus]
MSSFAALRDKRQARQGPSFASVYSGSVSPSTDVKGSVPAELSDSDATPRSVPAMEETKSYTYETGVYDELPDFLEVRESKKKGRGIYVKQGMTVKAGEDCSLPGEAVRALGRLVWARKRLGEGSASWKEVELMQSDIERLNPQQHEPLSLLGFALVRYLDISPQDTPPAETARKLKELGFSSIRDLTNLLSRFQTNSFSLTTPDLTNVGVAISPLAALISHSCMPNAVVVFPTGLGRRGGLEVIALRDLQPGEEVLTSYVDIALPRSLRWKELKDRYLFDCECVLCEKHHDHEWIDPREALRCSKKGCKGKMGTPTSLGTTEITCSICGTKLSVSTASLQEHVKLAEDVLHKAEAIQFSDSDKARYLLVSILRDFDPFALSAYPLLQILQLLQQLLITAVFDLPSTGTERDGLLQDAASCSALVLSGMEDVYPYGHPSKGIQYVTSAKLLMAEMSAPMTMLQSTTFPADLALTLPTGINRLSMSLELLAKATEELPFGFGKGGGIVGKDVILLATGLEREISMWGGLGKRR